MKAKSKIPQQSATLWVSIATCAAALLVLVSQHLSFPFSGPDNSMNPPPPPAGTSSLKAMQESSTITLPPFAKNSVVYKNTRMKFSISIPKTEVISGGECEETKGKGSALREVSAPVQVITLDDTHSAFITNAYQYNFPKNALKDGVYGLPACEKIQTTIPLLEADVNASKPFYSWKIQEIQVNNEDAVTAFLKKAYGSDCRIGTKKETAQKGTFQITMENAHPMNQDNDCFASMMSMHMFKYSPSLKLLAYWDMGQEATFWSDSLAKSSYDNDMIGSFRFEQ